MEYIILFLNGIITFISPCLLPMLPIYISYFAGSGNKKASAFKNAIGFVIGFTFVFVLMGAFAATIGRFLQQYTVVVNMLTGLAVVIFGLNYLGVFKLPFFSRWTETKTEIREPGFVSSLLFGIVFSISWTPCVSAFLGTALMLASRQGSTFTGILMLLVYSMGLGIPFIISALLIDQLKGAFAFVKKNYKIINALSGGLLVIVGIFMMTGSLGNFLAL